MKKLILTLSFLTIIGSLAIAQQSKYPAWVGKARGAAAQCIAGETGLEASVDYGCAYDANIVVSFGRPWSPPSCPPGQICPTYIIAPYDYVVLARVTMDCQGNILNVNCDPVYIGGPLGDLY